MLFYIRQKTKTFRKCLDTKEKLTLQQSLQVGDKSPLKEEKVPLGEPREVTRGFRTQNLWAAQLAWDTFLWPYTAIPSFY